MVLHFPFVIIFPSVSFKITPHNKMQSKETLRKRSKIFNKNETQLDEKGG